MPFAAALARSPSSSRTSRRPPSAGRRGSGADDTLYGLYEGTPRTAWGADDVPLPNTITDLPSAARGGLRGPVRPRGRGPDHGHPRAGPPPGHRRRPAGGARGRLTGRAASAGAGRGSASRQDGPGLHGRRDGAVGPWSGRGQAGPGTSSGAARPAARRAGRPRRSRRRGRRRRARPSRIGTRPYRSAASAAAPAGSRTCFMRSAAKRSPARISASDRRTIPSRRRRPRASVHLPAKGALSPSATLDGRIGTISPAAIPRASAFEPLWLDAVDTGARPERLHRGRDAAGEPAAADPDDDDVHVGQVLDDLQADRALAGDRDRVVERVDERQAARIADALHLRPGLGRVGPVEDHLRAVAAAGIHLGADRRGRHDDGGSHADDPGGHGHRGRVVARRDRR